MDKTDLKVVQKRLLRWETQENSLAPLTDIQRDIIFDLAEEFKKVPIPSELPDGVEFENTDESNDSQKSKDIYYFDKDNSQSFLKWYEILEEEVVKCENAPFASFYNQIDERKSECELLLNQIDASLVDLKKLSTDYNSVSTKTNALHSVSEQLLADQIKLHDISEDIKKKLHHFTQVEHVSQRLNSPTISISSDAFFDVLSKIDECIDYISEHPNFRESHSYLVKYKHSLSRAIGLIKSYVNHTLNHATEQILAPQQDAQGTDMKNVETAFAVYFGKFQAAAPKLKRILEEVEMRAEKYDEYATLLNDLQQEYAARRFQVAGGAVSSALKSLASGGSSGTTVGSDHCALVRSACSLLAHASRDEFHLHSQFFQKPSTALEEYLGMLCNMLYETLRPYIIHVNHLETLAELCAILRVEVIEEHVNNDPVTLSALGNAAQALLQDAQERLVFRAHIHLRSDVLYYRPAPGDLAYPDKLEMMEQIALSLQEQSMKRTDSHNSLASGCSTTSQEVANITNDSQRKSSTSTSPADLHGMWYPGVRRTLAALSRLYRCLERRVFQGLAQEALALCVASIDSAAKQIAANKTNIDGELFQIKHLLILREQIAPFQVDFIIKETTLDFSNVKNAAYGLIQNRGHIFALNSNNALLEFLIEGTPLVKEHLLDSRKEVDRHLKGSCESFIMHATDILAKPLREYVEKVNKTETEDKEKKTNEVPKNNDITEMASALRETSKRIKSHLAPLQRSMQLYLANKETEFILFRPIRNNIVGYFIQIEQILANGKYSQEDIIIASCPTPEQVTVLISSASLLAGSETLLPYGKQKRKISSSQISTSLTAKEHVEKQSMESEDVSQTQGEISFVV